jgi:hypothetical protein
MTKIAKLLLRAIMLGLLLPPVTAHATPPNSTVQPQMRTYVSGSGRDSNPCSATSPCQTFQAALSLTIAGGQIFVLDSANYGAVTINKAVSITSEGAVAGLLATSGAAITINAGAGDVINLRGLDIDGGYSGTVGIQFISGGSLNVQKSTVRAFANSGISFVPNTTSSLFVSDTVLTGNVNNGILVSSSGSNAVNAVLNRVTATRNGVGVFANGANVGITITETVAGNNSYGVGASSSAVMVRNSTLSNNTVGIAADQSAVVRVGQSTVTANGTGWTSTNGGQVQSYGNNNVSGNNADGLLTNAVALQ